MSAANRADHQPSGRAFKARAHREPIPREIWVLVVASFLIALGYGLIAPILPQFAQSFNVGVSAASSIVSVFALARLLWAPAGGKLIARFGERSTYVVGLLGVAASTAACAFAPTFPALLVARGIGGIGSATFTLAATGLIVRWAPPHLRGRVSALYGTAFLTGNIAGPFLGALAVGLGYRTPFLLYAAALTAASLVAGTFLSKPAPVTNDANPGAETAPDARATLTFLAAARIPAYRGLLAANFAHGWTNFGVRVALLPLFAAATPTLGPAMAGLGLSAYALGNFCVLQASGRLVDRLGRKPVLIAGLMLCAAATAALALAYDPVPFLGLSALAGMGASLIAPSQQAALADVVGAERNGGPAFAGFQMVADLGSFLGPLAAGLIADHGGYGIAFGLSGVLLGAPGLLWLTLPDTAVRRGPTSPSQE